RDWSSDVCSSDLDCKEHRWCIRNFLFLEFNTETGFPPMLYRPVKSRILPYRIAEDTVVYPLFHRIGNRLCNFNIHVCNPERFQAASSKQRISPLVLDTVCTLSRDIFIKIELIQKIS